jgi:putative hydrolase of the HAD superfamily
MESAAARSSPVIRGVFFDFDGTLYDRDAAIVRIAELQFEKFGDQFPHLTQSTFVERVVALDNHGHGRPMGFHLRLAEQLEFSPRVADDLEAYFRSDYPRCCRMEGDTVATLETLRAKGAKLGIVTNGPTVWQSRKIDALGLGPLFDTIVISGSEGIEKPDPRIFALALERCGAVAAESMFVGDHPRADIEGARNAGLIPVWVRKDYWEVPEDIARIDRISEVLEIVRAGHVAFDGRGDLQS